MKLPWRLMPSVILVLFSVPATSADLMEVYRSALQNDPQIREAEAIRLAALETKPQALAALLPQVGAAAGIGHEVSDDSQASLSSSATETSTATDSTTDFTQYRLQLTQTLFRWDQWLMLKRADAQVAQAEADYQVAKQDIILRTAQSYFAVLVAQDIVDAAQATLEAYVRQLVEAEKRFDVGLMAVTDVQEAKAAHDFAVAELIAAKRELVSKKELLRELTGEIFTVLAVPADAMPLEVPEPENEDIWVNAALEQNLNLISSRLAMDIARQDVRVARSGHYPTLDLVASLSGSDSDATRTVVDQNAIQTRSPLDRNNNTNSLLLQLNIPLYSGGLTSSRIRQQIYLQDAARDRLERTARVTERAARDAYLGVLTGISRVKALRQALESGKTALRATEASQEVGARTTVDVLDARRRLFEAQTNYSRSRYDYILNQIQLELAAGTLSQTNLEKINHWMR